MTYARRYNVRRRSEKNREKPESEGKLQSEFVAWGKATGWFQNVITEVDRGRGMTDVMAITNLDLIAIFECKGKTGLTSALRQLCGQTANQKWVVCPEREIRDTTRESFEAEGVGLIMQYSAGQFKSVIGARVKNMGTKAREAALRHFEEGS